MKKIIYSRLDGGISIVHPVFPTREEDVPPGFTLDTLTEEAFLDYVRLKDIPQGASNVVILDESEIPEDKTHRNAWVLTDGKITVDDSRKAAPVFNATLCEQTIYFTFKGSDYFKNPQAWLIAKLVENQDFQDVKSWAEANLTPEDLVTFKSCFVQNGIDFWPQ